VRINERRCGNVVKNVASSGRRDVSATSRRSSRVNFVRWARVDDVVIRSNGRRGMMSALGPGDVGIMLSCRQNIFEPFSLQMK
jgi:hypothetical protein